MASSLLVHKKFKDVDLNDAFFDSLKHDYLEFSSWFNKKVGNDEGCFVLSEGNAIKAFLYLKDEAEDLTVNDVSYGLKKRVKIGTLKISENVEGKRIGEGLVGQALRYFALSNAEEIYVTVFPQHKALIILFEKFGLKNIGRNSRGECVLIRTRAEIDFVNAHTSYPFLSIKRDMIVLAIEQGYHDTLFPHAKLARTKQVIMDFDVKNGVTKMFVGSNDLIYLGLRGRIGDIALIYRKAEKDKGFNSCVTGFASIAGIKKKKDFYSFEEFKRYLGNKTILDDSALEYYYKRSNMFVLELLDVYSFGEGYNINFNTLKEVGVWKNGHPYSHELSIEDKLYLIQKGRVPSELIVD